MGGQGVWQCIVTVEQDSRRTSVCKSRTGLSFHVQRIASFCPRVGAQGHLKVGASGNEGTAKEQQYKEQTDTTFSRFRNQLYND